MPIPSLIDAAAINGPSGGSSPYAPPTSPEPAGSHFSFGYGPEYSTATPTFGRRRKMDSYSLLNQGSDGSSGMGPIQSFFQNATGGGQSSGAPETWQQFLDRYLGGNDQERLLGMFGFGGAGGPNMFDPNAPALSQSEMAAIRARGEAGRLGAMNRARLDAAGDPSMMAYANLQSTLDSGTGLRDAMNAAQAQKQQSLQDWYRQLMMERVMNAMGIDLAQQSKTPGQGHGGGIGFTLPGGGGMNVGW